MIHLDRSRRRFVFETVLPWVTASALILCAAAHFIPLLPDGMLVSNDEYHTLDRTVSILEQGDLLTVYSNHAPSFKKPPLQYWLGAALLSAGMDTEMALRLIPFLWGLGTVVLTGALAAMLVPGSAVAALSAMLILSGSALFWRSSASAMLDSGAAFFTVASAVTLLAALRRPRLLWLVAIAVGLGALQKAPVAGICVLASALAIWRFDPDSFNLLILPEHRVHRYGAAFLTLTLIAAWPMLQFLTHGQESLKTAILNQMVERFMPVGPSIVATNGLAWATWLSDDSAWLWGPALAITLVLPLLIKRPAAYAIFAWVAVVLVALTFAGGRTFPRYLMHVLPFLAAGLAGGLVALLRRPLLVLAVAAGLWLVVGGMFEPVGEVRPMIARYIPMLERFRQDIRPYDTLVFCGWSKANHVIYPGALSVYASGGKSFRWLTKPDALAEAMAHGSAPPPYRGLCLVDDFSALERNLLGVVVVERQEGWVIWTAQGVSQ